VSSAGPELRLTKDQMPQASSHCDVPRLGGNQMISWGNYSNEVCYENSQKPPG